MRQVMAVVIDVDKRTCHSAAKQRFRDAGDQIEEQPVEPIADCVHIAIVPHSQPLLFTDSRFSGILSLL